MQQMRNDLQWKRIWVGLSAPKEQKLGLGPVVNYIADPDQCMIALRAASLAAANIRRPWFNHPDRIIATTRDNVSRLLQGIEGLIVPKVVRCRPADGADIVEAIANGGLCYPVLVRSAGKHGGKTLVRIDGPDATRELDRSAAADSDLYITEFHDFADEDGLYRRYRFAVVGGEVFIKSVIVGTGWNLHASSRIWNDQIIAQEREIIDTFDSALAPRIEPMIKAVYDRVDLDYFGIDCAVRADGSLVIFEVNSNMDILVQIKLKPDLWSASTARIKAALMQLLNDPARWAAVRLQPSLMAGL
jgi:hypothetical protein